MKKFFAILMGCALFCTMLMPTFGCSKTVEEVDDTKTSICIANYNGGVGEVWLENVKTRFEEKYKDVSYEEGKKGVQIILDHDKKYDGTGVLTSLPSDTQHELYFSQLMAYNEYAASGSVMDLTELVNRVNPNDNKKIIDKFYDSDKASLSADGKY